MRLVLVSAACLVALGWAVHVRADEEPRPQPAASGLPSVPQPSRLATLYAGDPLTRCISLATGEPGMVMTPEGVFNKQSDLDFGNYREDALTVGIESGREGVIVDLGSGDDLARRGGYEETVGGGQGFASLRLDANRVLDRSGRALDVARLFERATPRNSTVRHAVGHIYLVRLVDRNDASFERIAKILVVAHQPNVSVTLRWCLMRDVLAQPGSAAAATPR